MINVRKATGKFARNSKVLQRMAIVMENRDKKRKFAKR
jgi:hypothetical protein